MQNSDIKFYKAKTNGRMSATQITTQVPQNVWPHVTSAQRTAGYYDYAEIWAKVADDSDGTLIDPALSLDAQTLSSGDDIVFFVMDGRDAISDVTGTSTGTDTERKYGAIAISENITAGDKTIVVVFKNSRFASGDDQIFYDTDKIKLSSKAQADSLTGNEETLTIDGDPVVDANGLKVTLTTVEAIANSYTADGTSRVSSLINPADIEAAYSGFTVTTAGDGDYDDSTYPVILDNIASVDEDWTIEFDDATHFHLDGDSLGTSLTTGVNTSDFSPSNSDFTKPYFTLESAGFSGTWADGDKIEFTTTPAAYKLGGKRVVQAGTASLANNKATLVVEGEAV